jgi:nucleoside-diphosphate kinase
MESTLVIIKPDGVRRHLVGEILGRFERLGLDIARLEMRTAPTDLLEQHYPSDSEWLGSVGQKTLDDYDRLGLSPVEVLGSDDPVAIGKMVKSWLVKFMCEGPIVVAVLRGNRCVEVVRKVVGSTLPVLAAPGSIRGDFSTDSPDAANEERRPILNLIHASGDLEEATREIKLWFGEG